ncbi:MAG: ECF transporter S component [Oscillospiraceae bacterium]|nr:ECF transporter S component [Oscillospiraceae bacterium]MDD6146482.1 ECF transporter S component [Oscillospiraceae bacterium]
MRNDKENVKKLTILGLLTAVMLIFAMTPLGYLNIGPLAITLNVIPLGIAAVALGPVGGAVIGAVFGITSFLQCIGVGGVSAMGAVLFEISPVLAFIQRFVPRVLVGLIIGFIFNAMKKRTNVKLACFVTGFLAAFLNTVLFMSALILLFGKTDYVQELIAGRNIIVFICTFVGINAVFEMIASTLVTGAVGSALYRAKVLK